MQCGALCGKCGEERAARLLQKGLLALDDLDRNVIRDHRVVRLDDLPERTLANDRAYHVPRRGAERGENEKGCAWGSGSMSPVVEELAIFDDVVVVLVIPTIIDGALAFFLTRLERLLLLPSFPPLVVHLRCRGWISRGREAGLGCESLVFPPG